MKPEWFAPIVTLLVIGISLALTPWIGIIYIIMLHVAVWAWWNEYLGLEDNAVDWLVFLWEYSFIFTLILLLGYGAAYLILSLL